MKRIGRVSMFVVVSLLVFLVYSVPAVQSQTIHAILVGDTVDPNIGRGDKLDLDLMKELLRDASSNTGMTLRMKVFDDHIGRSAIMDAVKRLRPGNNDTVIFFYTGHGYRMRSFKAKWPAMALKGDHGGSAGLDLKWAYDTLKKRNPRLLIVMADACNNYLSEGSIDTHLSVQAGGGSQAAGYKKLFKEAKGGIIASSSIPGQYSYSGSTGSQFTVAFMGSIRNQLSSPNPTWRNVMKGASRPLMGGRQQPQFEIASLGSGDSSNNTTPDKDEYYMYDDDKDDDDDDAPLILGELLVKMESHILYTAQHRRWKRMRDRWITNVLRAEKSVPKMRVQLLSFEKNLLYKSQISSWRSQRPAWLRKVKDARTKAQLAATVLAVEKSLKKDAFISIWAKEQSNWTSQVTRLAGSSQKDDTSPDNDALATSFNRLLIELEASVTANGKSGRWNQMRRQWLSSVQNSPNNVQRLATLLVTFESNILYCAQDGSWRTKRPGWLSNVRSASSLSQLSRLMVELETSILYSRQIRSWRQRRSSWLQEVGNL